MTDPTLTQAARELCLAAGWCDKCYRPEDYSTPCEHAQRIAAFGAAQYAAGVLEGWDAGVKEGANAARGILQSRVTRLEVALRALLDTLDEHQEPMKGGFIEAILEARAALAESP